MINILYTSHNTCFTGRAISWKFIKYKYQINVIGHDLPHMVYDAMLERVDHVLRDHCIHCDQLVISGHFIVEGYLTRQLCSVQPDAR